MVLRRAIRSIIARLPASMRSRRYVHYLLQDGYANLSYVIDWRDAFMAHTDLFVRVCNINNLFDFVAVLHEIRRYPIIVVLHSAAGDRLSLIRQAIPALSGRKGKLIVFFGNEYNLMDEKIAFARETAADFIATQLPMRAAQWLYADCTDSQIVSAPAALNPAVYRPGPAERRIDVGFRGDAYSFALGDVNRTRLIERVRDHAAGMGIATDIEFTRVPRSAWTVLLQQWYGVVGAESGTGYLERDDSLQRAVLKYLAEHPGTSFEEIHERFFLHIQNPVSGKAISSRHFEPIGTKTCQVLLEGRYNDILRADEHYISARADLSDLPEAMEKLQDADFRRRIVERTYEYALANHTYAIRVRDLVARVLESAPRAPAVGSN